MSYVFQHTLDVWHWQFLNAKRAGAERCSGSFAVLHLGMHVIARIQQLAVSDSIGRYTGSGPAKALIMWVVLAAMYFLPTMLAWKRGSSRRVKVTLINVLLGWTGVGWILAMVMTFAYEPPPEGSEPDREHVPGTPRVG